MLMARGGSLGRVFKGWQPPMASNTEKMEATHGDGKARNVVALPRDVTNPWHDIHRGDDGRFTAKALKKQYDCIRALGMEKATSIAKAVGKQVGDVR
jgi:hypothetical protein